MTVGRRIFLAALVGAAHCKQDPAIAFAEAYNAWIRLWNECGAVRLDAREAAMWHETKRRWGRLASAAERFYTEVCRAR